MAKTNTKHFQTHYSAQFTAGFKPIVMKDRESVEITRTNAREKIWELGGYLLKQKLFEQ